MFCPRCGRAVNETSNFCGGCGLSRVEIEKYVVKTTPQPEEAKAETATPQPEPVVWESRPAEEPVTVTETEPVAEPVIEAAEAEIIADAVKETEQAKAEQPQYSYTSTASEPQQTYTQTSYTYTEPVKEEAPKAETASAEPKAVKNENLSTVDFIWVILLSSIPVVGLIYLIYLACQNDNTNKRSYARASLIISVFAVVISIVFGIGFVLSGL